MLKVAVLVSGGGTNLQAILDNIEQGIIKNTRIEIVISNKKDAYALERARKAGIPATVISPKDYTNRDEFSRQLLNEIKKYEVDLIVLAGYLVIIPEILIQNYRNKIINIHPSLIPAFCGAGYYGLRVHEAVLERGVKITGATVHFVDEGTDTGPIILQKAVEVHEGDSPKDLQTRVMEEAEWNILPEAINLIALNKVKILNNRVTII
ncbi:phosphoribosylglycinamide formyltransferase [Anaerocolumna sp. MB42-C2]|uniref:phosphoribosylglycinamide formyltransferase n=1 Tax=Anaerocolumna sp. MB42-C2 TaxID=3070997 RepID=UPI0027E1FC52|nr:phosphoribosylglycinamide formyltransferase [Anaerocolumna sp. MB42-C2]WMJ89636.1 phosphoribosylglycinamide formyltransferase [Anaerocolumna sp. MB42-C2]